MTAIRRIRLLFFGSYVVFAPGKFPLMRVDRTGIAIIGAVLMPGT